MPKICGIIIDLARLVAIVSAARTGPVTGPSVFEF